MSKIPGISHCHACETIGRGYITADCCTCCRVPPDAIPCPRCKANAGDLCRTPGGGYYDHKARTELAENLTRKARR